MVFLGHVHSSLLIYPLVKRKGNPENPIQLLEGRTFKSFLTPSIPRQFFRFRVFCENSTSVEIFLESPLFHGIRVFLAKNRKNADFSNFFLIVHTPIKKRHKSRKRWKSPEDLSLDTQQRGEIR